MDESGARRRLASARIWRNQPEQDMTTFLAGLVLFLGMHSAQAVHPDAREAATPG